MYAIRSYYDLVILHPLHPYRLEGARPHMQGDEGQLHALGLQGRQQRLVEVQARGRCRHRAGTRIVDGLVTLLVSLSYNFG